jgi:hypothetical protein
MLDRRIKLQDVNHLKAEYDAIPVNIQAHEAEKQRLEAELAKLQYSQSELEQQKKAVSAKLYELNAFIGLFTLPDILQGLEASIRSQKEKLSQIGTKLALVKTKLQEIITTLNKAEKLVEIKRANMRIIATDAQLKVDREELARLNTTISSLATETGHKQHQMDEIRQKISMLNSLHAVQEWSHHHHHPDHHIHHHYHRLSDHEIVHHVPEIRHETNPVVFLLEDELKKAADEKSHLEIHLAEMKHQADRLQLSVNNNFVKSMALNEQWLAYGHVDINEALSADMNDLTERLSIQQGLKKQETIEVKALEEEVSSLQDSLETLDQTVKEKQSLFKRYQARYGSQAEGKTLPELESRLKEQQQLNNELLDKLDELNRQISSKNNGVLARANDINTLRYRFNVLASNVFLQKMWTNPNSEVKGLVSLIETQFETYEKDHPARQSIGLRLCLSDVLNKMRLLVRQAEHGLSESKQEEGRPLLNHAAIQLYYQLCGLLYLKGEALPFASRALFNVIRKILPVDVHLNSAAEAYQNLSLPDLTADQLKIQEMTKYHSTRDELQQLLQPASALDDAKKLHAAGLAVLNELEANHKRNADDADIKFHTTILDVYIDLLRAPGNLQLRATHDKLIAENVEGRASSCKKQSGASMVILGAASIASSVAAKQFSWNIPSEAETAGIATGAASILSGIGLFYHGMQKGLLQKMIHFREAVLRFPVVSQVEVIIDAVHQEADSTAAAPSAPAETRLMRR